MHTKSLYLLACALGAYAQVRPPVTRQDNVSQTFHGVTIVDPYRWLEIGSSGATRAWIDQQNGMRIICSTGNRCWQRSQNV